MILEPHVFIKRHKYHIGIEKYFYNEMQQQNVKVMVFAPRMCQLPLVFPLRYKICEIYFGKLVVIFFELQRQNSLFFFFWNSCSTTPELKISKIPSFSRKNSMFSA